MPSMTGWYQRQIVRCLMYTVRRTEIVALLARTRTLLTERRLQNSLVTNSREDVPGVFIVRLL
ncbi:wsv307 [White spot syndrome virus]|uniref:Wsv307 n=4 Tax=White spot syndrome virus TaxID=342409 RepID=Q8VAT3_WSSVS|nr:wsv307 [Shrimp white spot syndrome virus]AFX59684.1 wsv307 [White spot syndrome virus]AAL33309.1 wsv307 [Shrimp white spot syndrome virus]AAL89231.1 WSSV363 [Shrimp white spot syndrome virus]AWQ61739.1 wsv307 [Shrimp white spot syndrome virus]AWQ62978.1 wsv307 [Shrimp white spot syndrome virus]